MRTGARSALDLLFVIDNSSSMAGEQARLAVRVLKMVRALVSGDVEGDGRIDFPAVHDLHVAVISTDMGALGNTVPNCEEPHFGDDGVMGPVGSSGEGSCADGLPSFLELEDRTGTSVDAFVREFACIARVGTGGCGFEQPFEAALKALTPSSSAIRFHNRSSGARVRSQCRLPARRHRPRPHLRHGRGRLLGC